MPYRNKEVRVASQLAHRNRNKVKLLKYLLDHPCVDCKEADPIVLEFDHMPGFEKKFEIGRAVGGSHRGWDAIMKEIEKCEVVCANCHRKRSHARLGNTFKYLASVV